MKRRLRLALWAVGSTGAVLWVCFLIFAIIYTRKFPPAVFLLISIGIFAAWEGFKIFREERHSK